MITISEAARLAGTTVRAVRLYHQRGLLPEPPRRPNGYRSYGAADVLALLRIRRMRELGLPLARIAALLDGPAEDLREALETLDDELSAQQRAIAARRHTIASVLAMPGDPDLPPPLAALFERAVAEGYPRRVLEDERDAVLLTLAAMPEALETLCEYYERALADRSGAMRAASEEFDALDGAGADDPRVEGVARRMTQAVRTVLQPMVASGPGGEAAPPPALFIELVESLHRERSSPAQLRVNALVAEALETTLG